MDTINSIILNNVEIQENGIIRNSKGYLIGRLVEGIDYNGEHIQLLTDNMPKDNFIEERVKEAHIKWLSKAETAIINEQEMTVLPYGYLGQALKEELELQAKEFEVKLNKIIEEIEKFKSNQKIDNGHDCYDANCDYCNNDVRDSLIEDILKSINN